MEFRKRNRSGDCVVQGELIEDEGYDSICGEF